MAVHVAIFGGSSGIGLSVAKKFVSAGITVHLLSRSQEKLQSAQKLLLDQRQSSSNYKNQASTPGDVFVKQCDVTLPASIKQAVQSIRQHLQSSSATEDCKLQGMVFSAGITRDELLVRTKDDDLQLSLQTNLVGAMLASREISRLLLAQKSGGSIILIGSVVGLIGNAGQTVYSAGKSGLIGFTKSLSQELYEKHINVNLISPGFVDTQFIQSLDRDSLTKRTLLQKIASPDEIAELVYLLHTNRAISGQNLIIDGGLSLLHN